MAGVYKNRIVYEEFKKTNRSIHSTCEFMKPADFWLNRCTVAQDPEICDHRTKERFLSPIFLYLVKSAEIRQNQPLMCCLILIRGVFAKSRVNRLTILVLNPVSLFNRKTYISNLYFLRDYIHIMKTLLKMPRR